MSAMPKPTMEIAFPWVKMTFGYTEQVAGLIPDELLDWRPEDPSGAWCFSLAEIAMHCADARLMFARQLSGNDSKDGFWSEEPAADGTWSFREYGSKQEILDSLKAASLELEPFMTKPASAMGSTTEGTVKTHEKHLKWLRENDKDTADFESRGPASIVRVLMAAACHEAGHRGSLQTLLRLKGINLESDAG